MAVQFLLSGRAAVPKSKQIINLGRRSFRARVLYFGYSRRDELPLHFPQIRWAPVPKWFASTKR